MRGQFGFLALANPAPAWPGRMGLEEGGKRREGRMGVGAQGRPFQRRSPGRIVRRLGERRQAREVAPVIEDRSLGTERGRRRGRVRRGGGSGWGRRDLGEGADDGPGARDVGISELRREGGAARRSFLARRRGLGGGFCTNAARRARADRAGRRQGWEVRIGELGREVRVAQRCLGRRRTDGGQRDAGQGTGVVDAFIGGARPRGKRQPRLSTGVGRLRGRPGYARGGGADGALVDRRVLAGRSARFRGERNQASAGAYGEKKARMENRHGSNPVRRGWTNFADQDLNLGPRRLAPFAWDAPELCVGRLTGAMYR